MCPSCRISLEARLFKSLGCNCAVTVCFNMFGKYFVVLLSLLVLSFQKAQAATIASARDKSQILLVVSYDSFNKKYLELDVSPNLKQVQVEGISVPYLRNVFTTKTFPNHFSIATGLYPDRHGVVNNVIFDKRVGGELKYGKDYYHMVETVTPIWVSVINYGLLY